jgi:hypothetical protein
MKKVLKRFVRLSPPMIVAMIALFVALSGTAIATSSALITGAQIKNSSITGLDVKNRSLRPKDFRGSVRGPRGLQGQQGPQGPQGLQGVAGPQGTAGVARAFARVQADGTLQPAVTGLPSQVKGVDSTDIAKGEGAAVTGTYCFGDLGFEVANVVVTLDNADAAAADRNLVASSAIERGEDLGDCPATHNQVRVRIVDGNTATAQDARFFIWFE